MATQKNCTGSISFTWLCPNVGCAYGVQLFIDAVAITSSVSIDCTLSDAAIETLLMAARINGFSGVISVVTRPFPFTDMTITISNVILPNSSVGLYSITITNPGAPCGDIPEPTAVPMTCSIIKRKKKKNGVMVGYPDSMCLSTHDRFGRPVECKDIVKSGSYYYQKVSTDSNVCCYKRIK